MCIPRKRPRLVVFTVLYEIALSFRLSEKRKRHYFFIYFFFFECAFFFWKFWKIAKRLTKINSEFRSVCAHKCFDGFSFAVKKKKKKKEKYTTIKFSGLISARHDKSIFFILSHKKNKIKRLWRRNTRIRLQRTYGFTGI